MSVGAAFALGSAALAQDTVEVPTNPSFSVRAADIPRTCASKSDDRFHVLMAGVPLSAALSDTVVFTPFKLTAHGSIHSPEMFMSLPRGTGCREQPVDVTFLNIPSSDPNLPHGLNVAAGDVAPLSVITRLRDAGCPKIDDTRVGCAGHAKVDGKVVPQVAVIASAHDAVASDGSPLFVICETTEGGVVCEADALRSGLTIKTVLKGGSPPTVEEMRAAYRAIDKAFAALSAVAE
jgi:hypothetical protein